MGPEFGFSAKVVCTSNHRATSPALKFYLVLSNRAWSFVICFCLLCLRQGLAWNKAPEGENKAKLLFEEATPSISEILQFPKKIDT